jgi:hypothetical protein
MGNEEKQKKETFKHIRFLIIFSAVYVLIKYGYPFLKQIIF